MDGRRATVYGFYVGNLSLFVLDRLYYIRRCLHLRQARGLYNTIAHGTRRHVSDVSCSRIVFYRFDVHLFYINVHVSCSKVRGLWHVDPEVPPAQTRARS